MRIVSRTLSSTGILTLLLTMAGCGAPEKEEQGVALESRDENGEIIFSDMVLPPDEYYSEFEAHRDESLSLADTKNVLYVNFNGATVQKGYKPGQSFIPCQDVTTIPPSGFSASERATIMAAVKKHYADTALIVTDTPPSSGLTTVIHVGGTYQTLGCSGSPLGIAPLDKGNRRPEDTAFVFKISGVSLAAYATAISHEAGHSYGLEHVKNTKDVLYPVAYNSTVFAVSELQSGAGMQDEPAILKSVLGAAGSTPAPSPAPAPTPTPTPAPTPTPTPAPAPTPTPSPQPSGQKVLYVNFSGATVTRGTQRGQAPFLCKSVATIPVQNVSSSIQNAVLNVVRNHYSNAGASLLVTNVKPTSGSYTTIHVGGTYASLGCKDNGETGWAPLDIGNKNLNDVGFVFIKSGLTVAQVGANIAHEAAHTFGVRDTRYPSTDLMNHSSDCYKARFTTGLTNDNQVQDAPKVLRAALGSL